MNTEPLQAKNTPEGLRLVAGSAGLNVEVPTTERSAQSIAWQRTLRAGRPTGSGSGPGRRTVGDGLPSRCQRRWRGSG